MVLMDMDMVDTKTNIKTETKTNTECFKDPMYAIFLKALWTRVNIFQS